jgi:hypothetical protein
MEATSKRAFENGRLKNARFASRGELCSTLGEVEKRHDGVFQRPASLLDESSLLAAHTKVLVDATSPEFLVISGRSAGGSSFDRFALVFQGRHTGECKKCLVFPKGSRAST